MIGEAYIAIFPFYDNQQHQMRYKERPVLIVGQCDSTDYVVLPISRVTGRVFLDPFYDVKLDPQDYPLMNLRAVSYVRTHKQTVINLRELKYSITDFKVNYEATYLNIIERMDDFQKRIIDHAF